MGLLFDIFQTSDILKSGGNRTSKVGEKLESFVEKIRKAWQKQNSLVCVGLDTIGEKVPTCVVREQSPVFNFNAAIVDATADLVCAYKPQVAFYSGVGTLEEALLEETIRYIHGRYPEIPVILDAKRNDIGNTAEYYVKEVFDRYGADAVTINPYLGRDACQPFLDRKEKGVILLCRTSNRGARDFQDLLVTIEGKTMPLYQAVAKRVAEQWNENGNCLLVMEATYPGELKIVRELVGDIPFLVPGIGAQGGDVEAAVTNGKDSKGTGMIINSSRGIIYASSGPDFAEAARKATVTLRDEINKYR